MDLNGDGNKDIFTGGYTGICFVLYGKNDGTFSKYQILKYNDGNPINTGKYCLYKGDKFRYKEGEDDPFILNFAEAVDWDNDGDYDLILNGHGKTKVCINEGSRTNPIFSKKNNSLAIKHIADEVVDWDGDGLWDIIAGCKTGGVYFYKNYGKLGKPEFREPICLLKKSDFETMEFGGKCDICQVSVTDYNGDGKLDLLVGNSILVYKKFRDLSSAETAERDKLEKELEKLRKKQYILIEDLRRKYVDRNEFYKAYQENNEIITLSKEIKPKQKRLIELKPTGRTHCYVRVSLRK